MMSTINAYIETTPSTFALLVDDIKKLSDSEQKLLWIQLNIEKLSIYAKTLDKSVLPNNLTQTEIDNLVSEAKKNGRKKKKS